VPAGYTNRSWSPIWNRILPAHALYGSAVASGTPHPLAPPTRNCVAVAADAMRAKQRSPTRP